MRQPRPQYFIAKPGSGRVAIADRSTTLETAVQTGTEPASSDDDDGGCSVQHRPDAPETLAVRINARASLARAALRPTQDLYSMWTTTSRVGLTRNIRSVESSPLVAIPNVVRNWA